MDPGNHLLSRIIEAAGGIVCRGAPEGPQVGIIHRPKLMTGLSPKVNESLVSPGLIPPCEKSTKRLVTKGNLGVSQGGTLT